VLWHDFGGDRSLCWEHRYAIVLKGKKIVSVKKGVRSVYGRTNTSIG